MSHGAGHILDMINRLKQNRALRPSNRQKFKERNRDIIHTGQHKLKDKKISAKELAVIKKRIKEKAKKTRHQQNIIVAVIFMITATIIFLVLKRYW